MFHRDILVKSGSMGTVLSRRIWSGLALQVTQLAPWTGTPVTVGLVHVFISLPWSARKTIDYKHPPCQASWSPLDGLAKQCLFIPNTISSNSTSWISHMDWWSSQFSLCLSLCLSSVTRVKATNENWDVKEGFERKLHIMISTVSTLRKTLLGLFIIKDPYPRLTG